MSFLSRFTWYFKKFSQTLVGKTFWVYFFTFLIAPTWYLIKMMISRSTSIEELWIMYAMINLVVILSSYNDLWLTETLRYFLPQYLTKNNYNDAKTMTIITFCTQFGTAIVIGIWLYVAAPWLTERYFWASPAMVETTITIVRYFSFYFLWVNLYQVLYSIFLSYQDTFSYKFVEFVRMWWSLLFIFVLYIMWFDSIAWYAWGWLVWLAVSLVVCFVIFWVYYKTYWVEGKVSLHEGIFRDIKSYALWAFIGINAWNLLFTIDKAMVIAMLWPVESGLYEIYASLINIRNLMIAPILWFIMSLTSSYVAQEKWTELGRIKNIFFNYLAWAWMTLWVLMTVLWPELAVVLFWSEYIQAGEWLMYSAWFTVLPILLSLVFQFLAWEGKMRQRVKIVVVVTILNALLNYVFITIRWVFWAIITTIIWWAVMFVSGYMMMVKSQAIVWQWKRLLLNTVFTLFLWLLVYVVKDDIFAAVFSPWLSLAIVSWLFYTFLLLANIRKLKQIKDVLVSRT